MTDSNSPQIVSELVGILLIGSAIWEAYEPADTINALSALGLPPLLSTAACVNVISLELVVGFGICFDSKSSLPFYLAISMLSVFTAFLFFLIYMPAPPQCGCGGMFKWFSSNRTNARVGVIRNALLIVMLCWSRKRSLLSCYT